MTFISITGSLPGFREETRQCR